jgi:outer membrane lipoprotein SlyB
MHKTPLLQRSGVTVLALALAACATVPAGPSLSALRGSQRTNEQFVADDARCRAVVVERLAATTTTTNQNVGASAAAGTAIGAATGAVFDGGSGAAVGAVVGMALGAIAGSSASATTQQQYDAAYFACMYALGHKVPVPSHDVERYRAWFDSVAQGPVAAPGSPGTAP